MAKATSYTPEYKREAWHNRFYKYVCIEISEVFKVASEVIECIECKNPVNALLAFNSMDFLYSLDKAQTISERETPHISFIEATINKICLERFRQGLSPFINPLECKLTEQFGKYIVDVDLLENEIQPPIPFKVNTYGYKIGLLHYDNSFSRFYVGGKTRHTLFVGSKFQLLNEGIFETTCLGFNGGIQLSTGTFHASAALLRGVRLAPNEI